MRVGFKNGTDQSWEIEERVPVDMGFRKMLLESVGSQKNVDFGIRTEIGEDNVDYGWVCLHMEDVSWAVIDGVADMTRLDPDYYDRQG